MKRATRALILFALAAATAFAAERTDFPNRPLRVVVGYAPGGGVDDVARILSQPLGEALGQPVVIDNRPGANGLIASETIAKGTPDGYALLMVTSSHAINPFAYSKLPYDTLRDFQPVSEIASANLVMVVPTESPAKTVPEFIAYAKRRNNELHYASAGLGNITQLAAELFDSMTGIKMGHIPYKGSSPALVDLLAGRVDVYFVPLPSALPHMKSGRLRALAVSGASRSATAPDVPTMAEQGVAGYEAASWYGLLAPPGTPEPIVRRLHEAVHKALAHPGVAEKMAALGLDVIGRSPKEFDDKIRSDMDKWRRVFKEADIRVE